MNDFPVGCWSVGRSAKNYDGGKFNRSVDSSVDESGGRRGGLLGLVLIWLMSRRVRHWVSTDSVGELDASTDGSVG